MGIFSLSALKKLFKKNQQKPNQDLGYLLASILVVYPEVSKVSYDPADGLLQLSFALETHLSEDEFRAFVTQAVESIKTYQQFSGFSDSRLEISIEGVDSISFLQIRRDIETLTRAELTIIATLVNDFFSEKLIFEMNPDEIDEEFSFAQEDKLDQIFVKLRKKKISDRVIGFRENEKVIIYAR